MLKCITESHPRKEGAAATHKNLCHAAAMIVENLPAKSLQVVLPGLLAECTLPPVLKSQIARTLGLKDTAPSPDRSRRDAMLRIIQALPDNDIEDLLPVYKRYARSLAIAAFLRPSKV